MICVCENQHQVDPVGSTTQGGIVKESVLCPRNSQKSAIMGCIDAYTKGYIREAILARYQTRDDLLASSKRPRQQVSSKKLLSAAELSRFCVDFCGGDQRLNLLRAY